MGVQVGELTAEAARQLGYDAGAGVLVTAVDPEGPAAMAGLREGVLILRVGKKAVNSVAEFEAAVKSESIEDGILLLIRIRGANRFVVIQAS